MSGSFYIAGLVVYTISFGLLLANLIIAIFKRKVKHSRFFAVLMLASCTYALGFLLIHLSPDMSELLQGTRVQYLGAAFVSPMLLLFIIDFCGIKQRVWLIVAILIIPLIVVILVFTYPFNGLYFGESAFALDPIPHLVFEGSIFRTFYFIYSYSIMLVAFIICLIYRSKRDSLFKKHSAYMLVAMLVPMVGNLLTAFMQLSPIDLTSVFACAMGTILAYTLLFTKAFQIAPLAREEIVENMQDGFILIDRDNKFIDANRTAKRLFPVLEHATTGLPITNIKIALLDSDAQLVHEFSVQTDLGTKHYRVSADEVRHEGRVICTCITIYDNTSIREMMDEITMLAEHDALTNLLNRRSFCRDAERKCDEILRYGGKAFFMMIDIDFFKKINDTYGHLAGDEVLRAVSKALQQRFRKTDILGRYGGEEFCAFLLIESEDRAVTIAEELRQRIEDLPIQFENTTIHVTISIGMAEFPAKGEQTLTALIARADEALYKAKEGGRNCVELAPSSHSK